MKKKFDLKTFNGKKRIFQPITGSRRISRLHEWVEAKLEYRPSATSKSYMARKYAPGANGSRNRITAMFATLEEARAWQSKATLIASLDSPDENSSSSNHQEKMDSRSLYVFSELVNDWKSRHYPSIRESTQHQYDKLLRLYFIPLMQIPVDEFTSKVIDDWILYLKGPDSGFVLTPTRCSFKHELRLLTTILRSYAEYDDRGTFRFPIKDRHRKAILVKLPPTPKNKDLTEKEFLLFREHLLCGKNGRGLKRGPLLAAMATLQFYQALRVSEAAAIHHEDLSMDFNQPENSRFRCTKSVFWPRKRGSQSRVVHSFKNAKANAGMKVTPLMRETFEALQSWYDSNSKGLIFQEDGNPIEYRSIQAAYDAAFKRAELPYSATHVMRHGFTREVYNETGDFALAGQLLGNTSQKSIEVYAKRKPTALNEYARKRWARSE